MFKVRRKFIVKYVRRGVSDLIVILALVAVAIPIMMTVQHWLSAQTGRVSSYVAIPSLYATVLSKSKTDNVQSVVIRLENKGSETYEINLNSISVVLVDGSVMNVSGQLLAGTETLKPASSAVILIKIASTKDIESIVLELTNKATGNEESISVSIT